MTTLPDVLGFDDIALQGLPFYGGNVVYHLTYEGAGHKALTVQRYAGAAIRAYPSLACAVDEKSRTGCNHVFDGKTCVNELSYLFLKAGKALKDAVAK